jgi:hypothetical protein
MFCPTDDATNLRMNLFLTLLMTFCWQMPSSGHTGCCFRSSISLKCKDFRLALEVLFSIPLWQPLTILRTYFTGLHVHLV